MEIYSRRWEEIRTDIKKHNVSLFNIIEDLKPIDAFYEIHYNYGEDIIVDGKFTAASYAKALDYTDIPMAMILEKKCELYVNNSSRIIPFDLFSAGSIFGTYEVMDKIHNMPSYSMWSIVAGARSCFSLQKTN